jgi:hypothetical protein
MTHLLAFLQFTHENLDNVTKYDADKQLSLNIRMAVRGSDAGPARQRGQTATKPG